MAVPGTPGDGQPLDIRTIWSEISGVPHGSQAIDLVTLFEIATGTFQPGYNNQQPYDMDKFKGYVHGVNIPIYINPGGPTNEFGQDYYAPVAYTYTPVAEDITVSWNYSVNGSYNAGGSLLIPQGMTESAPGFMSTNLGSNVIFTIYEITPSSSGSQIYSVG